MHDVDHPGRNNEFMKNSFSSLSITYNDQSVTRLYQILENHHCSIAFVVLMRTENIFSSMSSDDFTLFRKYVIHGIISTDMMLHKQIMADIQLKVDQNSFIPQEGILS